MRIRSRVRRPVGRTDHISQTNSRFISSFLQHKSSPSLNRKSSWLASHCVVFLIYSSHSIESQIDRYAEINALFTPWHSLACLVVMATLIFQKSELLSREVGAECDSRDAEARKGALEAVEAGEGACVPPLFTT
jgi:hypothetical protein